MDPITDGEVAALDTGLKKVLSSFLSLAMFKEAQEGKVPDLCYGRVLSWIAARPSFTVKHVSQMSCTS